MNCVTLTLEVISHDSDYKNYRTTKKYGSL